MEWDWLQIEAVILARVSDDREGVSDSTSEQVDEATEWCGDRSIDIIDILIEDDIGASRYSRKKRPQYERALALLSEKSPKRRMLITWESSRAQRRLDWYVRLRKVCEEAGALWMYQGRVYDMRDPDDRRRTAQDAIDDEYEVEKTRKRVKRDLRKVAADGRPHGKLPFGYKIVRDDKTGRSIGREIYEPQAKIVRDIARRILAGQSVRSVAAYLNESGIPAPRPVRSGPNPGGPGRWRSNTLGKMILSPTYAGLRVTHGEVTGTATWDPILTIEEHEQLKIILNNSARLTHRGVEPVWLLTTWHHCGECGGKLIIRKGRTQAGAYTCEDGFCFGAKVEPVEALVEEAVLQRLESPDVIELLSVGQQDSAEAFEEARTLQARLEEAVMSAAKGEISMATLGKLEAELKPRIAAAERKARAAIKSPIVERLAGPQARALWKGLSMGEKREVVRTLVEVRIFRGGKGTRVLNPRRVHLRWVGSDEPVPSEIPPAVPLAEGGDPMDFTVQEVLDYLTTASSAERRRVVELEGEGQGRHRIMRCSPAAQSGRSRNAEQSRDRDADQSGHRPPLAPGGEPGGHLAVVGQ